MTQRHGLLVLLLAACCGCSGPATATEDTVPAVPPGQQAAEAPAGQAAPAPQAADEKVTVVCEVKFYVVGLPGEDDLELLQKPDPKRAWDVGGFILEVIRPPEFAGKIFTMHHDGVLASGNPFDLWQMGKRYQFRTDRSCIGRFDFGPCSVGGDRQVVPK